MIFLLTSPFCLSIVKPKTHNKLMSFVVNLVAIQTPSEIVSFYLEQRKISGSCGSLARSL